MPPTLFGYNPNLKTVKYDPEGARKLLAEAGYPNGFGVTLHTPNNRYVNDEKIAQTIAQNLTRVGIVTKVEAMPMATYSAKGIKHEFSFGLLGWGAQTGEVSSPLRALLACEDSKKGFGTTNWGEYCNPKMDVVLEKALATVDDKERSGCCRKPRRSPSMTAASSPSTTGDHTGHAEGHHLRAPHR